MRATWPYVRGMCVLAGIALVACSGAPESTTGGEDPIRCRHDGSRRSPRTTRSCAPRSGVTVKLPYCQSANHQPDGDTACSPVCTRPDNPQWDPYRSDCSGLVSWAWGAAGAGAGHLGARARADGHHQDDPRGRFSRPADAREQAARSHDAVRRVDHARPARDLHRGAGLQLVDALRAPARLGRHHQRDVDHRPLQRHHLRRDPLHGAPAVGSTRGQPDTGAPDAAASDAAEHDAQPAPDAGGPRPPGPTPPGEDAGPPNGARARSRRSGGRFARADARGERLLGVERARRIFRAAPSRCR